MFQILGNVVLAEPSETAALSPMNSLSIAAIDECRSTSRLAALLFRNE
jgi:hypothetical protein